MRFAVVLAGVLVMTGDGRGREFPVCPLGFAVRPATGGQVASVSRRLQLGTCTASCAADVRVCRAAATGGCVDAAVAGFNLKPRRRLAFVASSEDPLCSDWMRIEIPVDGSDDATPATLRAVASLGGGRRPLRRRLRVDCRRAPPVTCAFDGVPSDVAYDATCTGVDLGTVARVAIDAEHRLHVTLIETALTATRLEGLARRGATVEVEGYHADGGDALSPVSGSVRRDAASGDVMLDLAFGRSVETPVTCRLTRPAGGTPAEYGGTRRLVLEDHDEASSMELELDLDLPPSGVVRAPRGVRRDSSGAITGHVASGLCLVTPLRRFSCGLQFAEDDLFGLSLFGRAGSRDAAGADGQYYFGAPPVIAGSGVWHDVTQE